MAIVRVVASPVVGTDAVWVILDTIGDILTISVRSDSLTVWVIVELSELIGEVCETVVELSTIAWEQLSVTIDVASPTVGSDENSVMVEASGETLNIAVREGSLTVWVMALASGEISPVAVTTGSPAVWVIADASGDIKNMLERVGSLDDIE